MTLIQSYFFCVKRFIAGKAIDESTFLVAWDTLTRRILATINKLHQQSWPLKILLDQLLSVIAISYSSR